MQKFNWSQIYTQSARKKEEEEEISRDKIMQIKKGNVIYLRDNLLKEGNQNLRTESNKMWHQMVNCMKRVAKYGLGESNIIIKKRVEYRKNKNA